MPRLTIQQFRATLNDLSRRGLLVTGYRTLCGRPQMVAAMRTAGWMQWPDAASANTHA